jgi:peptidoglycan/xylan/chitin deacetylase (PgdA/CDA1 family)
VLRVLTYHRVASPVRVSNPTLVSATPELFSAQMRRLVSHWHVVSIQQVLKSVANGTRLPADSVLLTFDDAYNDFAEVAWPILKEFQLPAVLFVPTAYPGHPETSFWWDELYSALLGTGSNEVRLRSRSLPLGTPGQRIAAYRTLRDMLKLMPHEIALATVEHIYSELHCGKYRCQDVLTWDNLRRLDAEGVVLAAHSQTHPILTGLSLEKLEQEIEGSQCDLMRAIGHALPIFCYPNGAYDPRVVESVRRAGFVLAFTTAEGHNQLRSDNLLTLRRTNVTLRTTPAIFSARLTRFGPRIYGCSQTIARRLRAA